MKIQHKIVLNLWHKVNRNLTEKKKKNHIEIEANEI